MTKYKIKVTEILQKEIEIEADNLDKAIEKVEEMYDNSEIVLDSEDFVSVDFNNAQELEIERSLTTNSIEFNDLKTALQEFDENGIRSEVGKWSIVRGAYDMQFEIHYEGMTILQCIDNQLEWVYRPEYWDSETEKSLIDLVANTYGIKMQKTISTIKDLKQAIEDVGWSVSESDIFSNEKCWILSKYSPEEENFSFSIHHHNNVEEIIHEINEYVFIFDKDEYFLTLDARDEYCGTWIAEHARDVETMLNRLSDYCNNLNIVTTTSKDNEDEFEMSL